MNKRLLKSKLVILVLITISAALFAFLFTNLSAVELLHLKSVNTLYNIRGPLLPADTSIVMVGIDDETLASLQTKWPFPESYHGRLVDNLTRAGAKAIVFDIEFLEPNLLHPEEEFTFAEAIYQSNTVILAGKVVYDIGRYGTRNSYILRPIESLLEYADGWGTVNIVEDADGFLRRYVLYQTIGQRVIYPLAIETLRHLDSTYVPHIDAQTGELQLGALSVPRATGNTMYINFAGPAETFRTYSFVNVLDDSTFIVPGGEDLNSFDLHLEWQTFKDKIVLVGATAEELQDNKLAPFFEFEGVHQKIPGVEIHANALSTLLNERFLTNLPHWMQTLFVWLLAALVAFLTLYLRPFKALFSVIALVTLVLLAALLLFVKSGIITVITTPLLGVSSAFIFGILYQTVIEQREKHRIRQTFRHYVSPTVVDKLLNSGEMPAFGGERRHLTVLFSDIRKFTSYSETHPPEVVVSRLSEYLTQMVDVIFKYNGTLDKFVGDEIMALFGAPYSYADHAERACHTALEMIDQLRLIQKRWSESKQRYFHIGIGINTGKAIVGNLGSNQLFDYTVIGDEINIGARLEGANKFYQTTILISEQTYQEVQDQANVRELDIVRVVGLSRPIRIYELRSMNGLPAIEQELLVDVFSEGLAAYRRRNWGAALKQFRRILRYFPTDGPSRIYTIRCLDNIEHPPPDDWDSVHELKQK